MTRRMFATLVLTVFLTALLAACNLVGSPEEPIDQTAVPSNTPAVTSVNQNATGTPTPTVTALPFITRQPPTAIVPPTSIAFATPTSSVSSIAIFSPVPGSIVSGAVTIFGSAVHPNFLQYQLEYGPEPNFSNLWYPIGTANIQPVLNNVLGVWATNTIPDGVYAVRMRVFLRDGSQLQTIVNTVRVQNTAPTPPPTNTPTIPRPIAAFTQDRITGDVPLTVRFFNQSSGQITGYQWQFGDGSTSTELNPTYTFRNAGVYTVTLTVSGPGGRSNVSRTINVNQGQPPVANFTADPRSGNAPLTVRFTDSSTGVINQRTWYFGDGATSNELNPTHTYQNIGEYNVILEVRGPGGATQRVRKITVTQPNIPAPVASFTADPTTGDKPLIVRFTSTSSGQINSYLWEFGNGQTSIDPNPVYLYENEGTYDVSLTVSGPGGQNTATGRITVTQPVQAPDAGFTANPTQGEVPLNVQFTNTSTGDITGYEWNFGDGTALSTAKDPQHLYEFAGTYTVRLTVFGANSTVDFAEQVITVTEPIVPPDASFEANPEQGTAPLDVQFTNNSSGTQVTYAWDFGDGSTSDSQDTLLTHTYQAPGTYTVRLTASSANGTSDFAERTITVNSALPNAPVANFTVATTDLTAQFTDVSTGEVTAWAWDFGDGATSTEQNPAHTYAAAGTYPVTLTVSNAGGSNSIAQNVTVTAPLPGAPVANFTVATTDLTVQFTDASTGEVTAWAWDFGDGATSTEQNPAHTYAAAGTYPVTLTVSNAGGSNSIVQDVTVTEPAAPSLAETTDVMPNISALAGELSGMIGAENRTDVFAVIGDRSADAEFMLPFGDADYVLNVTTDDLQSVYDRFSVTEAAPAQNSFARTGAGVRSNFSTQDLLTQPSNAPDCNVGETVLDCELRVTKPAVVFLAIGYNDARGIDPRMADMPVFRANVEQIVDRVISAGAIPVLMTPYPRLGEEDAMRPYADTIIEVANARQVPVFNVWRLFRELQDSGLAGENPSVAPAGSDRLNDNNITIYGANARHYRAFLILKSLTELVFP